MNLILLGLPGAGKGTQAKLIVDHLTIPHISTGEIFRKAYEEKTKLGILARNFMDKGELVPDDVTIGIAINRISEDDCLNGFLLDGFPRNLNQAKELKLFLESITKEIDLVLYVAVEEDLLLQRLTGRRVCTSCGTSYHILNNPPKVKDNCDNCKNELIQRQDDREETVKERLKVNKELTFKLVEFYKNEGKLQTIDGSKGIEEVTRDLLRLFEEGNSR